MPTLTICMGLPGSGKSYWATRQTNKHYISKDYLRGLLFPNGGWTHDKELSEIIPEETRRISQALREGKDVIVDSTNFAHEARLRGIAAQYGAVVKVEYFNTDIGLCIKRDAGRPKPVGEAAIRKMAAQFQDVIFEKSIMPVIQNGSLASCLIVDIDGTIAKRNPARASGDYSKLDTDWPVSPVIQLVNTFVEAHKDRVLIVSARPESTRDLTTRWLDEMAVQWDDIYLRDDDDTRRPAVIKWTLYNRFIRDKFWVRFVLDDQTPVVRMWRALGFTCLQPSDELR